MTDRRLWGLLLTLYFAQGLPFGLITRALPAVAREAGLPLHYIGLLALAALPWALKFLWAPYVDQLGRGRRNHRKRWLLVCQLSAVLVLCVMALLPLAALDVVLFWWLLALLLLLNLAMATHDIATDGLAVRLLPVAQRGPGNSIQAGGYKIGLLAGGALLLFWVSWFGWASALLATALLLALLLLPLWRFAEPLEAPAPAPPGNSVRWWWHSLLRFWARPGMPGWLGVLLLYKVGDSFGSRMLKPFLIDQGWSLSAVASLDLLASLAGLLAMAVAGWLLLRWRRLTALLVFAVLQGIAFIGWAVVAAYPGGSGIWLVAVAEQMADGLATVALFTVMMDHCRRHHEGSDYTLQASMLLLASGLFTLASGFSAAAFGYSGHFLLAAGLSFAAIMPALYWGRGERDERAGD